MQGRSVRVAADEHWWESTGAVVHDLSTDPDQRSAISEPAVADPRIADVSEGAAPLGPVHAAASRARPGRWLPVLAAMLAAVAFSVASPHGTSGRRELPFDLEGTLAEFGLGIDEVHVRGHRRTLDAALFDAIDLPAIRSELSLDTRAIERRLMRLPWIERATVTRRYPDALEVVVRERTPAAIVLSADGRGTLVDVDGRSLGPAATQSDGGGSGLVRIEGEGAAAELKRLKALLSRHAGLAPRLDRAERVAGRRWTLHLTGGLQILLPPDADGQRDADAIDEVMAGPPGQRLVDRPLTAIDARVTGRLVLRAKPGALAQAAPYGGAR